MTNILIQTKTNKISYEEVEMDWNEFLRSFLGINEILDFGSDFVICKTNDNVIKTAMVVDVINHNNIKWFLHRNEVVCTYRNDENAWILNEAL